MVNPDMGNMEDHYPHREDQVEAWIKDRRDEFNPTQANQHDRYTALNNLLDEYRLAADTGQSLFNIVNPDDEDNLPTPTRKKKPKRSPRPPLVY